MSKFVSYDPSEQGINFTGRSQGFTSMGEVFGKGIENLAKTASLFVDAKDQENKRAITKEADANAENILSVVPDDPDLAANVYGNGGKAPAGLESGLKDLQRYASAYTKGGNSDLDVQAKLRVHIKNLRMKYPGYAETIDEVQQAALNSKPANRVRMELNQLIDKDNANRLSKLDGDEKFYRTFVGQNGDYIASLGIDVSKLDYTNTNAMRSLENNINHIKARELQVKTDKNLLELKTAGDASMKTDAIKLASTEVSNKVDVFMKAGSQHFDEFMKTKTSAMDPKSPGGVSLTPEETAQITQTWSAVSTQLRLETESLLNSPTYADKLGKDGRENVRSIIEERLKIYDDLLTNGQFGLFNGVKNDIENQFNGIKLDNFKGAYGDYTQLVSKAQASGIPLDALEAVLSEKYGPAGLAEKKLESARKLLSTGALTGNTPLAAGIEALTKDGVTDPKVAKASIEDLSFALSNNLTDPTILEGAAKSVYGQGNKDTLLKGTIVGEGSKRTVFNRFTSDQVFQNLKKNPELYTMAENWTKDQFVDLHRKSFDALVSMQDSLRGKGISIQFDEKSGTLIPIIDPKIDVNNANSVSNRADVFRNQGGNAIKHQAMEIRRIVSVINPDLVRLNKIIKEGNSGLDPLEEVKLLLNIGGMQKLPDEIHDSIFNPDGPEGSPKDNKKNIGEMGSNALPQSFLKSVDMAEGGGDYDTLYGHAQKTNSPFKGIAVSQMSIKDVISFSKGNGEYGQYVKQKLAEQGHDPRVATPMGRYQIVGETLRGAVEALGIDPEQTFDKGTQDRIATYLARQRISKANTMSGKIAELRKEWDGYKNLPDSQVAQIVRDLEA